MSRTVTPATAEEIVVNIADFAVAAQRGVLSTVGLGSCVAVAIHDAAARVTALAHVLLPTASMARGAPTRPAKFADLAVPLLVREMRRLGAQGHLTAKLVGGARMFGSLLGTGINMGERNVEAIRHALAASRVRVVAEDVGGEYGRSVIIDVATFRVRVTSLQGVDRVL
ncbi:MAG TPA: chemotaxis protein CheD [Gemmatimonadaceae bacterium]|nr:chemotaxis protein CheD [Gemmatimonadaceae bacterium]